MTSTPGVRPRSDESRLEIASDDRGAVLVEFAMVVPVLMLFLFAIVQFGIAYDRQQTVTTSARIGARFASVETSTRAEISSRVKDVLGTVDLDEVATIVILPPANQPCDGRSGEDVTVAVSAPQVIDIPFWGRRAVTLDATSVFQCE